MKKVVFIHSSIEIGGIETFLVRLSTSFSKMGIRPKIIFLYKNNSNISLLDQLKKVADIYFWEDIVFNSVFIKNQRLKILLPLNNKKIKRIFSDCEVVHVANALTYFCAKRISSCLIKEMRCVFGVYHSNELAWDFEGKIPAYEKYFRGKVFSYDSPYFLFTNDFSCEITFKKNNISKLYYSKFPLGIDFPDLDFRENVYSSEVLKIVSLGRLVNFKTYNFYMLDVIKKLLNNKFKVEYYIYGSGPDKEIIENEIKKESLFLNVKMMGEVEYHLLDKELKKYDLFVGGGTALLHAAANGLPCVAAIENEAGPNSYGFFSDIPGIDYHDQSLNMKKFNFYDLIESYINLNVIQKRNISIKHRKKIDIFNMETCANNFLFGFESARPLMKKSFELYIFIFLFFVSEIIAIIFSRKRYFSKYDQKL